MAIRNKKFLLIASAITLVISAGILALWLYIEAFKPRIEAVLSTAVGMEVRIKGKMGIALFPGFGLSLKNVNVRNKGVDVVSIEKMRIGLKIIPLARFQFEISQVGLARPVFFITRSKDGLFNIEKPEYTLWEKFLSVKDISISHGSLIYTDEASSQTIEIGDLDLGMHNLFVDWTNRAAPFKKISFTGEIRCKTLKSNDFTLMNLMIKATARKGIFDANPIRMNIFGGAGNAGLHVDMTGPLPHYRLICTLGRVRIEELIQLSAFEKIPQKTLEGTIDVTADLTAIGKRADEIKRSLAGNLELNGQELMLHNVDIDALIMKYERSQNFNLLDLGSFFLAGPFGPILTKSYDFASVIKEEQGGKGSIGKLVSVWKVENGVAEALDVALASKQQRLAMQGGLDFINERFVGVTIAALDKRGCALYSEKVQGPFKNPQIEKENIFKSIAGPVLNPMQDAWQFIQGQECTVFYSGSVAHPEA